jgi:hypothetical protein
MIHQYNDVEYFVAHLLGNNGLHPVLLSHSPFRQPVYGIDLHSDHLPVIHFLSSFFTISILPNVTIIWGVCQTLLVLICICLSKDGFGGHSKHNIFVLCFGLFEGVITHCITFDSDVSDETMPTLNIMGDN